MKYAVSAFYKFFDLSAEALAETEQELKTLEQRFSVCGLIILAPEGLNATLACPQDRASDLRTALESLIGPISFKASFSYRKPFRRFRIKVRSEIVTLGRQELRPDRDDSAPSSHLSPEQWNALLQSHDGVDRSDIILLDTRNAYETKLGTFRGAVVPNIDNFTEFPRFLDEQAIPKDKKVFMFCTGGIRCEKAQLEMKQRGYEQVYQLDGGILNYLEQFPNGLYEGECFVFDHRVAVDNHLQPSSRFRLCPHCGDPGDIKIICKECDAEAVICEQCSELANRITCSKNCQYHFDKNERGSEVGQ
jgi:UPF0176 protein